MKKLILNLIFGVCLLLAACGKANSSKEIKTNEPKREEIVAQDEKEIEPEENEIQKDDTQENDVKGKRDTRINKVDFSKSFGGINGCAIFYDEKEDRYDVYNSKLIKQQISPFSTFKIISTLMGLDAGVLKSTQSTMGYNGEKYWNEAWNKDLTLEEAFQTSCVWYYKKVVSGLNKDYVQKILNNLEYGNCDLSAWTETGHNGFWLSSSLKISTEEQIQVLVKIFNDDTPFSKEHIDILKQVMLADSGDEYDIYGKTGSAQNKDGWFVGFYEKEDYKVYFAVRLEDESLELAGPKAKEITFDIINRYY